MGALLLGILGCAPGAFVSDAGEEPLRTALFFAPDVSLSVATTDTRKVYLLLANSTVPCEPEAVVDDPSTDADEPSTAREYWSAQLGTAFVREGARVALLALTVGPGADWLGRYPVHADAWDAEEAATFAIADGRAAAAAWLHVEEAAVEDAGSVLHAAGTEVVEAEHDFAVDDPAWVDVTRKDEVLSGEFDFDSALAGRFSAARCDNAELLTELSTTVVALAAELE